MADNPQVVLTFNLEKYELDIDAPALPLDFALSLCQWAVRLLKHQERIYTAQNIVSQQTDSQRRTAEVLRKIKLQ